MTKKILLSSIILLFAFSLAAEESSAGTSAGTTLDSRVQMAMSNPDYMVTPGDVYVLTYAAGTSAMQYKTVVDTSYKIRVANLAVLDAAGKSFIALKKQVEDLVARNYPMSGVQFALVTPAVFNVVVKGEVAQTAELQVWGLTRLSSVVYGNTTPYTSFRNITVTSSSGVSKNYDLYNRERNGDFSQDPYLRPGDVITLHKFKRKVSISGSVKRPGTYEILDDENLKDLIDLYGDGLDDFADVKKIEITRRIDGSDKSGSKIYFDNIVLASNFELNSYDSVFIDSLASKIPVMYMEGAVLKVNDTAEDDEENIKVEGSTRVVVNFNYDENYGYFLRARKAYFDSAIADIANAFIVRGEEIIPIDISKVLYDADFKTDLVVQPGDILRVPMKQFFVSVSGSVQNPGRYPYIPNKTYEYYIGLAGGFDRSRNSKNAVDIRDFDGNKLTTKSEITPETTITAETNSFLFFFNQYAPVITTILSIISTTLTIFLYVNGTATPK